MDPKTHIFPSFYTPDQVLITMYHRNSTSHDLCALEDARMQQLQTSRFYGTARLWSRLRFGNALEGEGAQAAVAPNEMQVRFGVRRLFLCVKSVWRGRSIAFMLFHFISGSFRHFFFFVRLTYIYIRCTSSGGKNNDHIMYTVTVPGMR